MGRKGGDPETTPKKYRRFSEYTPLPTKPEIDRIEKVQQWKRDLAWLHENPKVNREIEMAAIANPGKSPERIASIMRQGKGPLTRAGRPVSRDLIVRRIEDTKRKLAKMGPRMVDVIRDSIEGALAEGEFDVAAKHATNTLKIIAHKGADGEVHRVVEKPSKQDSPGGITVNIGMVPGGARNPLPDVVITPEE